MLSKSLNIFSNLNKPNRHSPTFPHSVPFPSIIESVEKKIFDPDNWPLGSFKISENESINEKENEKIEKITNKKERNEIIEENRSDGHAPIKTALSALLKGVQQSSSMTTSLSDIDVTLFNFHSTKFAEKLLNRNVSSVVIVESSHTFSKNAKKFATQFRNVDAYRADISTLMGVGRKKTAKFPEKLLFSGKPTEWTNIKPFRLKNNEKNEEKEIIKYKKPHLLAVLPTPSIQKTLIESLMQHALLHHSNHDPMTIFAYGEANLLTFLSCGVLSQYICSIDQRFSFLSHQHKRRSSVFNKLFEMSLLHLKEIDSNEKCKEMIPIGYSSASFHPQLPFQKKVTHEKKLAELHLHIGKQYAVRIFPKKTISISGKLLGYEKNENNLDCASLLSYAYFMEIIGKQPNAKKSEIIFKSLWPESCSLIPEYILNEKIGLIPDEELEHIFLIVRNSIENSIPFQTFVHDLRIKRIV